MTTLPANKLEPMKEQFNLLKGSCFKRLEHYELERSDIHWRDDEAYRHIEKAFGEMALAYYLIRMGADPTDVRREVADSVNHMLMALDIHGGDE